MPTNTRIVILIPFFGNLNCKGYFQKYLDSVKKNTNLTIMLWTDDRTNYKYPRNVKVCYTSFEEFKTKVQECFDFKIVLDKGYKICDFRPAFGQIFYEDIKEYEWFGWSDIDLIWGNSYNFISDDMLDNYEQIYSRGSLTLIRNSEKMRRLYLDENNICGEKRYLEVFTSHRHYAFDEWGKDGGYIDIVRRNGIKLYDAIDHADIAKVNKFSDYHFEVYHEDKRNKVSAFVCRDDGLYRIWYDGKRYVEKEYLYVHFQKRVLKDLSLPTKTFMIVPNHITITENEKFVSKFHLYKSHFSIDNIQNAINMKKNRINFLVNRLNKYLRRIKQNVFR